MGCFFINMTQTNNIFICPPTTFTLAYEINAWMNIKNSIEQTKANLQWETLKKLLTQTGAEITTIQGDTYPDSVFIANAGLIIGNTFILSRFRHIQRQPEEKIWKEQFLKRGYRVIQPPENHYFEGAGDALFFRNTLIGGTGFRSTKNTYDWIKENCQIDTLSVELIDPYFYHLDTCFCPLTPDIALIYADAFSKESLEKIKTIGGTLIYVEKKEAHGFACNSICINKSVILPKGNVNTEKQLLKHGFNPIPTDMSEYIKSGGSVKCTTLCINTN